MSKLKAIPLSRIKHFKKMYDKNQEGKIFLNKEEEINNHIQYVISMELFLKEIMDSGLLNLMIDYNLTWEAVYNIVKESIEDDE